MLLFNITTYHITFLLTQCMFSPHAGLDHPLVDKLCKYHLLSLYIVRDLCRQNTKRIQLLIARCSGDAALYAIRRWPLILYSAKMDRGGNPSEVAELLQGVLKTVGFRFILTESVWYSVFNLTTLN